MGAHRDLSFRKAALVQETGKLNLSRQNKQLTHTVQEAPMPNQKSAAKRITVYTY